MSSDVQLCYAHNLPKKLVYPLILRSMIGVFFTHPAVGRLFSQIRCRRRLWGWCDSSNQKKRCHFLHSIWCNFDFFLEVLCFFFWVPLFISLMSNIRLDYPHDHNLKDIVVIFSLKRLTVSCLRFSPKLLQRFFNPILGLCCVFWYFRHFLFHPPLMIISCCLLLFSDIMSLLFTVTWFQVVVDPWLEDVTDKRMMLHGMATLSCHNLSSRTVRWKMAFSSFFFFWLFSLRFLCPLFPICSVFHPFLKWNSLQNRR